jgi:hypothetical protein
MRPPPRSATSSEPMRGSVRGCVLNGLRACWRHQQRPGTEVNRRALGLTEARVGAGRVLVRDVRTAPANMPTESACDAELANWQRWSDCPVAIWLTPIALARRSIGVWAPTSSWGRCCAARRALETSSLAKEAYRPWCSGHGLRKAKPGQRLCEYPTNVNC